MSQAQIDNEIDTLVESYKDLQDAKQKFKESLEAIKVQRKLPNDKSILVPLTSSIYVPGYISNTQDYLIDIGTQYLVEKDADGAIDYFERKMKFIDVQLAKFNTLLQSRVQAKNSAAQAAAQAAAKAKAGSMPEGATPLIASGSSKPSQQATSSSSAETKNSTKA